MKKLVAWRPDLVSRCPLQFSLATWTGVIGVTCLIVAPAKAGSSAIQHVSSTLNMWVGPGTYGWGFNLPLDSPGIVISQIGVFDEKGDGLANAHPVAVWRRTFTAIQLSATGEVPPGEAGEFFSGFRYTSIEPIFVAPGQSFLVAAFYPEKDSDSTAFPEVVTRDQYIPYPAPLEGLFEPGATISAPTRGLSRGEEGMPNYEFYAINFRFAVVPEPQVTGLIIMGLSGIIFLRRR
jgi:hypothetical protein